MKVSFCTLGCKVNQYETVIIEQDFKNKGFDIVPFGEKSDVTVINTCAVTEESSRKSRQMMHRAARFSPNSVIVVVGCLSQSEDEQLIQGADVVVGSNQKRKITDFVEKFLMTGEKVFAVNDIGEDKNFESMRTDHGDKTRAQIKIQDGCNNFCSYCIIPYTRGRIRSKDINEAYSEVVDIVRKGYKEIVLTGIHLDSYGKEHGEFDLCDLLEKIDKIDGIRRIRLGSLEPIFINDFSVDRLVKLEHLCPHFHLSLQSGSDDVLKKMNRHYSTSRYREAVDLLRSSFQEVSITTDVIIGFPSETEKNHKQSIEFVKNIGFSKIHVFPFSPRKGTVAYDMEGQISSEIKKRRTEEMLSVSRESSRIFLSSKVGKQAEVLFERLKDGFYFGLTPDYADVKIKSIDDLSNTVLPVNIISSDEKYCYGVLAKSGGEKLD